MEETISAWKGLQTIVRIQSTREILGNQTQETRYYISDENESKAAYFNKDKLSVKRRLYKAALDREYLKKMMGI